MKGIEDAQQRNSIKQLDPASVMSCTRSIKLQKNSRTGLIATKRKSAIKQRSFSAAKKFKESK